MDHLPKVTRPSRRIGLGFLFGLIAGACIVLGALECSRDGAGTDADDIDKLILAKVGGREFTVADIKKKIRWQFPQMGQGSGPSQVRQQMDLFRDAVDQLCLVTLGEKKGYDKDQEFKDIWELSRRYILADRTMQKEIRDKEVPTDEEIAVYFNEHGAEFMIPVRVQVALVLVKSKAEADAAYARLRRGESIGNIARQMSIDEASKKVGGVIGWMTETSGAGHLGKIPQINSAAMQLHKGEFSPPVQIGEEWAIVYAVDRTEAVPRSLDPDVKEAIRQKVQTRKHNELYKALVERMRNDYGVQIYEDNFNRYAMTLLTEEDLWSVAQVEKDAAKKVVYYQEIVRRSPDGPRAAQAQFMVGFVQADELKQYGPARDAFQAFLKAYPSDPLADSARWMIENMEKPNLNVDELREIRRQAAKR